MDQLDPYNLSNPNDNRKLLWLAGGAVAAFTGFIILAVWLATGKSGRLEVSLPANLPAGTSASISIQPADGKKPQSFSLDAGKSRTIKLPKGTTRVDATAGDRKAIDVVEIQGRKTVKLQTPGGEQRAAVQLTSQTQACPVIIDSKVYSYACAGTESRVLRHDQTALHASVGVIMFNNEQFTGLQPYKKGLLGYRNANNTSMLVYLDLPGGTIQTVPVPDDIKTSIATGQPEVITRANSSNPQFALAFQEKKLLLFKDIGDTKPLDLLPGAGIDWAADGRTRSVSLSDDRLVVYSGTGYDSKEGIGEGLRPDNHKHEGKVLPGYVFEYDMSGKLVATLTMPNNTQADSVHRLTSGYYVATYPGQFNFYYQDGNALSAIYGIADVGSWTVVDSKAYVQANGSLYEFSPKEKGMFGLHSIFGDPSVTVSEVFAGPSGLLFTGFLTGEKVTDVKLYQLSKETASAETLSLEREPSYQGLEVFLNSGITTDHIANLKLAFAQYIASTNKPVNKVSLTNVDVVPHNKDSASTTDVVNFSVIFDDKKQMEAKLEYSSYKDIRLYLYETGKAGTVFDSGLITNVQP